MGLNVRFIDSIHGVEATHWNALSGTDYPFLRHEFLAALEDSESVSANTGWQPCHIIVEDATEQLQACAPLYIKSHSYGEYVFDWAWADAYQRMGKAYYPKLLSAIPYTPATGPRIAIAEGVDAESIYPSIVSAVKVLAERIKASSWHCLFPRETVSRQLSALGCPRRTGCQFHWINDNYQTFDDFLATFTSRKRKNLRKERRTIALQGLELETVDGSTIDAAHWREFYRFYHLTYLKRSGNPGYLTEDFFLQLAQTMPEQLLMTWAYHNGKRVAGALYFVGAETLYGRYWGCIEEFEHLHFEACYYRGIEYCIKRGLKRFDPGAQGEHKIQRGFTPTLTYSNHWVADTELGPAIADYLRREHEGMLEYQRECSELLPFKQDQA